MTTGGTASVLGGLSAARGRVATIARAALDLVLPPRCLACGTLVGGDGALCLPCRARVRFVPEPLCRACGHPLAYALAGALSCAACRDRPSGVERIRSAVAYDEASRRLVLGFKHGGRIEAAPLLASWLVEAGRELLAGADGLVPVPLHRWRLLRRGYNQSGLLARRVAAASGVRFAPRLLERHEATRSQQGLGAAARGANVTAAAFRVRPGSERRVRGARLVLVDDVLTTGATLAACADVLRAAGAERVDALTVARVVRDGPLTI